uniref:Ig-like domain-containing protein n=1 Tax=Xiphophorus couchianus TaxID=32473 RepID=A0A3B5MJW5_9TELE
MFSSCLFLTISLLNSLCGFHVCPDNPVMTPSRLVVKFGDPASATCVACQQACFPLDDSIRNMEASLGTSNINGSTVTWTVNQTTEWNLTPKCYYTTIMNDQCCTNLPVTVYKPPESVSFSLNPSGPLTEGSEVTLQCDVQNVAPAENLTVTFYRGHKLLGQVKSSNTAKKPVNEIFSMSYNNTKEDNGVQFWCEAKLVLGAEGPQPPLVVKSDNLTATVYCKGEPLHLTCLAEGNPKPRYNWTLPPNRGHISVTDLKIDSVDFQDGGQYVCTANNTVNSVSVRFDVTVRGELPQD